jgi:hypothetical protein
MHKRFSQSIKGRRALLFARAHDAVDCNERVAQVGGKPYSAGSLTPAAAARGGRRIFRRIGAGDS